MLMKKDVDMALRRMTEKKRAIEAVETLSKS
jgi:hypothetical protein